jgi:hypothetical protein
MFPLVVIDRCFRCRRMRSLDMRRSMPSDPDRFGLYGSPAFADADAGSLDTMRRTSPASTPATPSGPTMAELDSRAFDAAMQDAAAGNLGAMEEAFWGITNSELGATQPRIQRRRRTTVQRQIQPRMEPRIQAAFLLMVLVTKLH